MNIFKKCRVRTALLLSTLYYTFASLQNARGLVQACLFAAESVFRPRDLMEFRRIVFKMSREDERTHPNVRTSQWAWTRST